MSMNSNSQLAPALGRVLMAAIFLYSGFGKLTDPTGTIAYIQSAAIPMPVVAYWITVVIELLGGVMLLVGFKARVAALVLALFSVAAALRFHTNFADQNQMIHFMKNVAIAGGLLQVYAFGPGGLSVDSRRPPAR